MTTKRKSFPSKAKAEKALEEVLKSYPAAIVGRAHKWEIEGHGYTDGRKIRIHYFLGEDGVMHEFARKEVA